MNKFRASFSVLNLWKQNKYEDAVKMYFKFDVYENEAMKQGKEFHQSWQEETKKTGCLPEVFGGKKLTDPTTELKLEVQIYDWLEFVGVIDCLDSPSFYEYKTGVVDSKVYANSPQIGMYALLLTYADVYVDRCEIYHLNQHNNTADMSIVHITDRLVDDSLNFVITTASEMHDYLTVNNLYDRFKK